MRVVGETDGPHYSVVRAAGAPDESDAAAVRAVSAPASGAPTTLTTQDPLGDVSPDSKI